ncbi:hypothetical protein L1987_44049 [Smallanthus sonchifolius]|uniref:Uncharacterized protein n=1 Tax=Smallanthus sonchifolius TaxID=185202 RepID=A0ACB9GP11_9ASTR|nr:hypothetical protein L1987_44049 [Smallanthus sonchifolius]
MEISTKLDRWVWVDSDGDGDYMGFSVALYKLLNLNASLSFTNARLSKDLTDIRPSLVHHLPLSPAAATLVS